MRSRRDADCCSLVHVGVIIVGALPRCIPLSGSLKCCMCKGYTALGPVTVVYSRWSREKLGARVGAATETEARGEAASNACL